jgi:hypothetical protein
LEQYHLWRASDISNLVLFKNLPRNLASDPASCLPSAHAAVLAQTMEKTLALKMRALVVDGRVKQYVLGG